MARGHQDGTDPGGFDERAGRPAHRAHRTRTQERTCDGALEKSALDDPSQTGAGFDPRRRRSGTAAQGAGAAVLREPEGGGPGEAESFRVGGNSRFVSRLKKSGGCGSTRARAGTRRQTGSDPGTHACASSASSSGSRTGSNAGAGSDSRARARPSSISGSNASFSAHAGAGSGSRIRAGCGSHISASASSASGSGSRNTCGADGDKFFLKIGDSERYRDRTAGFIRGEFQAARCDPAGNRGARDGAARRGWRRGRLV